MEKFFLFSFGVNESPAIIYEGKHVFDWKYSINLANGELKKILRKQDIFRKYQMLTYIKSNKKNFKNK